MKIFEDKTQKELINVTLYLTLSEVMELRDSLESIIGHSKDGPIHEHVPNADHSREITVSLYEEPMN